MCGYLKDCGKGNMIKIENLKKSTLIPAVDLVNSVFPEQGDDPAIISLAASLNMKTCGEFLLKKEGVSFLRYWTARKNKGRRVAGVIGLYCHKKDEKTADWLGWFCVTPKMRKKGVGKALLLFAIKTARKRKKKFLRLWTSNYQKEAIAHKMYEKYGFVKLPKEERLGYLKKIYYELKL